MNPIEHSKGKITNWNTDGTVLIRAKLPNIDKAFDRKYDEVLIEFIDSRPISDKQRRACYAMIGEIAKWMGQYDSETRRDLTKEWLKLEFQVNEIETMNEKLFSLATAPVSLIAAFQKFLVHFIVENDVPCNVPLLSYVDDINDYVYYCMINKKCVICGKPAELHHVDVVGMGRNRTDILHEGMEAISLCRVHHTEIETIGNKAFFELYHLDGGIVLDKTLCRIYKLKAKKEEKT